MPARKLAEVLAEAAAHLAARRATQAKESFEEALRADPSSCEALGGLGNAFAALGRLDEAASCYRRALDLDARSYKAHLNLGNVLLRTGRHAEAAEHLRQALGIDPRSDRALALLGAALRAAGDLPQALASFERAIELNPGNVLARNDLALALQARGELDAAIAAFERALELDPSQAAVWINLAGALRQRGRLAKARAATLEALRLRPGAHQAHSSLGAILQEEGDLAGAIASYSRAIEAAPAFFDAHNNLACALQLEGRLTEAVAACRRALRLAPRSPEALSNLAGVLKDLGRPEEAVTHLRAALEAGPNAPSVHSNLLLTLHYLPGLSREDVFAEHRRWAARHAAPLTGPRRAHPNQPDPHRRLRVGYVSPDMKTHSVASFLEPIVEGHDRERFEVFCYSDVLCPDEVTERLKKSAATFRDSAGLTDTELAERVAADRIDILVDLAGHTARGRLLSFARKPAPVQVTYLGYPDTTGLDAIDYRLTDEEADPAGDAERFCTEELVRLPRGAWCFRPPRKSPGARHGGGTAPVLGCFNHLAKVTEQVVRTWAAILARVPDATLVIKSRSLDDDGAKRSLFEGFSRSGIGADRVRLLGWDRDGRGHLERYCDIDVALDTFPYCGTTTTCEALWMGVPVVTLAGRAHVERVGASLLSRAGLGELVAPTPDAYVELAVGLARDPGRLRAARAAGRERFAASPILDEPAFVRSLEEAYSRMWTRWCVSPSASPRSPGT